MSVLVQLDEQPPLPVDVRETDELFYSKVPRRHFRPIAQRRLTHGGLGSVWWRE